MVYPPREDSHMLGEQVKVLVSSLTKAQKDSFKVLDMGSGSGIQARVAIESGIKRKNIIAADLDLESIKLLKKQRIPARKSNLFSNINKEKKFDIIIFNAPYLPSEKDNYDNKPDTTAGKQGNEIILKFLRKAKPYLTEKGIILLLFSNLSKPEKILNYTKKRGYESTLLEEKNVGMMEKLFVYKFEKN